MGRLARLAALIGATGSALWIIDARRRAAELDEPLGRVLGDDVRELMNHRLNPVVLALGLAGGRRSAWGVLEHVGRESGKTYHTPVLPIEHEDHLYIPLTYGADVPMVKNIRASGHCRLQVHEMVFDLDEPMVVAASEPVVPAWVRPFLGDRSYLRLHVLDVAPGTFAHPHEVVEEPAEAVPPAMAMVRPAGGSPEDAITAS